MKIRHITEPGGGYFMAENDGREAGRMTYTDAGGGKIMIDHTEVDPALQGRGVGRQMVMASVAFAREKGLKIVPLCSFAHGIFVRDPSIRDVLYR
jgi:predicted GNAT family acetyltransferase